MSALKAWQLKPRATSWIGSWRRGVRVLVVLLGVVLKVRTKDGTLVVEVNQPDAEVSVDDGKVTINSPGDNQPVQVQVAEGKHTLRVTKGGFETFTKEFTIRSGGKETIRVELLRKNAEFAADPAKPAEPVWPRAGCCHAVLPRRRCRGVRHDPHRRAAEAVLKLGGTSRSRPRRLPRLPLPR